MECKRIVMNYTIPPGVDDLEDLASFLWDSLPEELTSRCEGLAVAIEEIAGDTMLSDLDVDDPFELLAFYRDGKEISPGVARKVANKDDVLVLYRRPILDMWCETQEDLQNLIRQIIIEELGRYFEFSDDDVEEMTERHYQGLL
ncbi:MAG: metallopeptidase family protein [Alphaproteobacteria bacterium]|nr:metallopeptidase family protein [Alphaproteobacteria bacterium]